MSQASSQLKGGWRIDWLNFLHEIFKLAVFSTVSKNILRQSPPSPIPFLPYSLDTTNALILIFWIYHSFFIRLTNNFILLEVYCCWFDAESLHSKCSYFVKLNQSFHLISQNFFHTKPNSLFSGKLNTKRNAELLKFPSHFSTIHSQLSTWLLLSIIRNWTDTSIEITAKHIKSI